MVFTDETLVSFVNNGERKAAMIVAGRSGIGYRDAALNVARLVLEAVRARVVEFKAIRKVAAVYENEFSRWSGMLETAKWTLSVYEKA